MLKLIRPVTIAGGVLAITAMGATGVAFAGGGAAETEDDQAAQDAACVAAGVNPNASNINFDGEDCSRDLDGGGGSDND